MLDAGGNPVAGAEVLVKPENSGGVLGNLYTQEDGRFAVGDFAPGESIVLSARSRTGESGLLGPYTAGVPGSAEIEVKLSRARTGMITTEGFRDILELARQRRPHYYNLDVLKPTPPALRDCRIEVPGRIGHDGSEVTALNEDAVRAAVNRLRAKQVEALAICMMHSYADPAHERRARSRLDARQSRRRDPLGRGRRRVARDRRRSRP